MRRCSSSLLEDALVTSGAVEDGDYLDWVGLMAIGDQIVRIAWNGPEQQSMSRKVTTCVATGRVLCDLGASIVDGTFDAVCCVLAVPGDVTPDREDVGSGERGEDVGSSSCKAPICFHCGNLSASLFAVDEFAAFGLKVSLVNVR